MRCRARTLCSPTLRASEWQCLPRCLRILGPLRAPHVREEANGTLHRVGLTNTCPFRYSDSDDEDRSPDFKRPQWAESPELRAALAEQAYRDPDELFGPIKPISMEELFKVRQGKFRARTSSANWAKGDGLTRAEEVEYARRMGFRPIGQGSQGSGA